MAGGQGKLEQLLINMHALSFFFLSVEEEEEDEEMAEVKPGLESEQQDEDESRETKEGWIADGGMLPHSSLCSLLSSPLLSCCWSNTITCVCHHMQYAAVSDGKVGWGGGGGHCGSIISAISLVGVSVD